MKQLIIKNEVVEMTFEEVLEEFTSSIHKEINRQKSMFNRTQEERDDMFQDASVWLWKAYQKYDIELGYHFSTFAKRYIQRGVQNETVKNNTQKRDGVTVSMDQNLSDDNEDFSLSNILSEEIDFDSPMVAREVMTEAINIMTDLEVEYLMLMLNDYTISEVAENKHVAKGTAQGKIKTIKDKIRLTAMKYNY